MAVTLNSFFFLICLYILNRSFEEKPYLPGQSEYSGPQKINSVSDGAKFSALFSALKEHSEG